jgi:hypothetical protein
MFRVLCETTNARLARFLFKLSHYQWLEPVCEARELVYNDELTARTWALNSAVNSPTNLDG